MSSKIKTYNPKEVVISAGPHIVTGIADDSFVTIEANGDGITKKVGCDGEIVRAVSPDGTYKVKIALLQTATPISARRWTKTGRPATVCSPCSSRT